MKRISMLLVAVMMLTAVAATANPFSDVPFSHWSYDAVNKLTSKGILQGYPDGTFKGERNVTRYHLAMVVAKMLSSVEQMCESGTGGSLVTKADLQTLEKLTVEFADELALLGVKVTALEDDMQIVKEDVASVKRDVENIKGYMARGGMEKVAISGDMIVRHDDNVKTSDPAVKGDNVHTSAMFRLRFDANIDENVTAAVRYVMYADQFGNKRFGNLGGAAANVGTFAYPNTNTGRYVVNPRPERQNDVDTAYLSIKDMFSFGGDFKFGRDFYTHGSALVLNDYVDAISYSKKVGEIDMTLNAIYDRTAGVPAVDFRQIWNLNLDGKSGQNDWYLGYYSQDYEKDRNQTFVEIGTKAPLGNNGTMDYEVGYVYSKLEDLTPRVDEKGGLVHAAINWDSKEEWAMKVAYTAGDKKYNDANVMLDLDQRSYDYVETPFEDIAPFWGHMTNAFSMQKADLVKVQAEYRPNTNTKHYFRLAYDMLKQGTFTGKFNAIAAKEEANVMTFEYRYQLAENTRVRAGYATFDGDKTVALKAIDDDRLFVEIYSRF